eukprot:3798814-Pyramimonas_sp.AAC.1
MASAVALSSSGLDRQLMDFSGPPAKRFGLLARLFQEGPGGVARDMHVELRSRPKKPPFPFAHLPARSQRRPRRSNRPPKIAPRRPKSRQEGPN